MTVPDDRAAASGPSPQLPSAKELSQALATARTIKNEWKRRGALEELAPHLSGGQLSEALAVARTIGDEWARARALLALVPHCSGEQLSEALAIARTINDGWGRRRNLEELAPRLTRQGLSEALIAARGIEDEDSQAEAFVALAPFLSVEQLSEALATALSMTRSASLASVLHALAPRLTEEQLSEALAAARRLEDENSRAQALVQLAPHLSPLQLSEALAAALAMKRSAPLATALRSLAPHLSDGQASKALAAARGMKDDAWRTETLSAFARYLSEDERTKLDEARANKYEKKNRSTTFVPASLPTEVDRADNNLDVEYESQIDSTDITTDQDSRTLFDPSHYQIPNTKPPFDFRTGTALLRIPRLMWLEIRERAHLRVVPNEVLSVAERAAIERAMTGRGKTEQYAVSKLGLRMKAVLHADEARFRVKALSSEAQDTDLRSPLVWDWDLTPIETGETTVTVRITILRDTEGRELTADLDALNEAIMVGVKSWIARPRRFWRDNWKWVLGSSGVGLIGTAAVVCITLFAKITP